MRSLPLSPSAQLCAADPPRFAPQVSFEQAGQQFEVTGLVSEQEAGLVCEMLSSERGGGTEH